MAPLYSSNVCDLPVSSCSKFLQDPRLRRHAGASFGSSNRMVMRKADIEKYKRTLLDMKSRLQGSVEGMRREALEAEDGSPSDDDPADHGTTHYDQDLTLSLLEDRHETMKRIDAALARVEDGKFGTCEGCNAPIARARLEALPHARLCVDCQERLDELG